MVEKNGLYLRPGSPSELGQQHHHPEITTLGSTPYRTNSTPGIKLPKRWVIPVRDINGAVECGVRIGPVQDHADSRGLDLAVSRVQGIS